jgi:hypothetical protein
MHTAARSWIMLASVTLLAAAEPPTGGMPIPPITSIPPVGEPTLPVPRPLPLGPAVETPALPNPVKIAPGPTGSPIEEPAPAPRELNGPLSSWPPGVGHLPQAPGVPPGPFREEAAPQPREQTPPPPHLSLPGLASPAPLADVNNLHHEAECLRLECDAMLHEEMELRTERDIKGGKDAEASQLRRRITDLLAKAASQANGRRQPAGRERPPVPVASTQPPGSQGQLDRAAPDKPADILNQPANAGRSPSKPSTPTLPAAKHPDNSNPVLTDAPVDPQSLAMALFLTGEYEAALNAYRKLEQDEQKIENHVPLQYMIACCLRKLGKLEEATTLYREVANSGGNEILVENSQWYLRSMKERHELETQLEEMRQRRQTAGPKKP